MQITLGPQYHVGEVLGLDGVRNLLVYSTTQYYNTIVIKCIQYKYKRVTFVTAGLFKTILVCPEI